MSSQPRLSVCLIVRNEEAYLQQCLESVRDLWDELIVVDTGSTDRTVEIARSFGARVFDFTWQDDFALARNYCLDQATGDWILSLDADETIAARDHAAVREDMQRANLDAVTVAQRHYMASTVIGWKPGSGGYAEGEPYSGYLDVDCRRLFRRRPWLRWKNRVHEVIVSTDAATPLAHAPGSWVIHHFGKVGDRDVLKGKGEHYLRILLKKIKEHPKDPQALHELGVQYGELQQHDEARVAFERLMTLSPNYSDTLLRLGIAYVALKQHKKAFDALRKARKQLPHQAAEIALVEGNLYRDTDNMVAAENAYRRGLAAAPAFAALSNNLALLYQKVGRHADALACVTAALKHNPKNADLARLLAHVRRGHARALTRDRRFEEARASLEASAQTADAELESLRGAIALGLREVDTAIAHLRASLELQRTQEAAMNLSMALECRGDRHEALAAAATAVATAPHDAATTQRFARLAGDTLRQRKDPSPDRLTLFFSQQASMPFDGRTPYERPLGGTESALVYLARALAHLGHRVVVFNCCKEPGVYDGVEYAQWDTMLGRCLTDRPDVMTSVRFWDLIGRTRLAPVQIFWTGDAADQPYIEGLSDRAARSEIDFFMLQSDWQAETFQALLGIPAWQVLRTNLGAAGSTVEPPIRPEGTAPRARRLAYASTPFRGLDVLLDVFPRIRAACPDAELDVFSSMKVYGISEAEDQKRFGEIYAKARQPGVNLVGSIDQRTLAQRLQQSRILAYPNHFAETFCIAAIEAQAAGCVVVTSALGALPQTVGTGGICIPGDTQSAAYQDAFVEACVALLKDDGRWLQMSEAALARSWSDYTWAAVAGQWDKNLTAALTVTPPVVERISVHLAAGRAALAQKMLEREAAPETVSGAAWEALGAFVAWRAGSGAAPTEDALRLIGLHFRALGRFVASLDLSQAA
jgi:glycosyltransferase involved in cell wall biosynthesis/Flp pilus assembly protein TadD